jgi:hypothetical protein
MEEKERHGIYGAKTFVVKGNIADRDVQFVRIFEGTAERENTIIGGGRMTTCRGGGIPLSCFLDFG